MGERIDYAEYLQSEAWKIRRKWKLEQADFRCQVCNNTGVLHVHHRTYERLGDERENDLTVLCRTCHERFHDRMPSTPLAHTIEAPKRNPRANRFLDWFERNDGKRFPAFRIGLLQPETAKELVDAFHQGFEHWTAPQNLTAEEKSDLYVDVLAASQERGWSL